VKPSRATEPNIDTIVVPAQEHGFKSVFLARNEWYAVRLNAGLIPRIRYVAIYRVAPVSAITHIAKVKRIVPYKYSKKYLIEFDGPAESIGPIRFTPGARSIRLRNPRYSTRKRLTRARTLSHVRQLPG